jgi:hypothetical protein
LLGDAVAAILTADRDKRRLCATQCLILVLLLDVTVTLQDHHHHGDSEDFPAVTSWFDLVHHSGYVTEEDD